jgi:hypothetical protein
MTGHRGRALHSNLFRLWEFVERVAGQSIRNCFPDVMGDGFTTEPNRTEILKLTHPGAKNLARYHGYRDTLVLEIPRATNMVD